MTTQTDLPDLSPLHPTSACPRGRAAARASRAGARTWPRLCVAVVFTGALWTESAQATKPRHPRAASAPSTAQILAPSAATVPDALPPERSIYRCGNRYSSTPCGDAQVLDIADARSDAQRRQAEDLTGRDKRLAAWYEAGRRERETVASAPVRGRAAAAPQCVSTTMMTCVPKKPRSRTLPSTATSASAPALHR